MNSPTYYFSEEHYQALKITGLKVVYYQVKQYSPTTIKHRYGSTEYPDQERFEEEWKARIEKDFKPCTQSIFEMVVADYYNKERENAEKARAYFQDVDAWRNNQRLQA